MKRLRSFLLPPITLAATLITFGCSSGSGSGGSASLTSACQKGCDLSQAQACPNEDPVDVCVADCKASLTELGACESESAAYLSCYVDAGVFLCTGSGKAGLQIPPNACESQKKAVSLCAACIVQSDDDPGDVCLKQNCCSELKALGSSNISAFSNCLSNCGGAGTSCLDSCGAQFPAERQAFDATIACESSKCAGL